MRRRRNSVGETWAAPGSREAVTGLPDPKVGGEGVHRGVADHHFIRRPNALPLDGESDDVMIAAEVADLLRMNVKTVYELAKAGDIPCWRLGRHLRFSRRALVAMFAECKSASHRKGS